MPQFVPPIDRPLTVRGTEFRPDDTPQQHLQQLARIALDEFFQLGVLTPDGILLECNRTALAAGTLMRDEAIGKPLWETFGWTITTETQEDLRNAVLRAAGGESVRQEVEVFGQENGQGTLTLDFTLLPVTDETGQVVFLLSEGRDITEKKAYEREAARLRKELAKREQLKTQHVAEVSQEFHTSPVDGLPVSQVASQLDLTRVRQAAAEANERASTILESMTDAFLAIDRDGRVTYMNAEAERINAMSRDDVVGRNLWDVFPAAVGTTVDHEFRRACADQVPVQFENYYEPLGRWFEVEAYPSSDGGLAVFFHDVTGRKSAEVEREQLIAQSDKQRLIYEAALSNTPDLVYVFDLDHRFTYANEALLRMWGRSRADAIGKNCLELGYEPWHAAMHDREIEQVVATRQPIRGEVPFTGTNGRRIYDYIFVPVIGQDGNVVAVAGTTRDVTERQHAEQAIREQAEQLRENDRRKDEFLAMLAHELRNPLAAIANAAQVTKRTDAPEYREWSQGVIEAQVKNLSRMIDDLLDVSRITRGKIQLRKQILNLGPIVDSAVETVRTFIEERKHRLLVDLAPALRVEGDPTRLEQIIVNLLNNAAKYTESSGRITLTAAVQDAQVVITVEDTGVGMTPQLLAKAFDLFAQGDRTIARSEGGLGIGLTLVRSLVEMHGGSVTATSEGPSKGSRFTVRLPVAPKQDIELKRPEGSSQDRATGGSRILVVDDNPDTALGMARLLKLLGHDVRTAHDGLSAIQEARSHQPDVILLDLGLPGMDGYEVARTLRDDGLKRTVIIAVSGYGEEQAQVRSRQSGFDHHLVKPVDFDSLVALIGGSP